MPENVSHLETTSVPDPATYPLRLTLSPTKTPGDGIPWGASSVSMNSIYWVRPQTGGTGGGAVATCGAAVVVLVVIGVHQSGVRSSGTGTVVLGAVGDGAGAGAGESGAAAGDTAASTAQETAAAAINLTLRATMPRSYHPRRRWKRRGSKS